MAQLRHSVDDFSTTDTEVLIIGPEKADKFQNYFEGKNLPFKGLPDPKHTVLKLYGQQIKLFKFGRMPAQVLIDKEGIVRFGHYGHDMRDIPEPTELISTIKSL